MEAPRLSSDIQPLPAPPPPPPHVALSDALPGDLPPAGSVLSPIAVRLRLLSRAHAAGSRGGVKRALLRVVFTVLGVLLSIALGVGVGVAVFWVVYDNPERYTQHYHNPWNGEHTYFVRGQTTTQQAYDYFLQTNANTTGSVLTAVAVGGVLGFFALLLILGLTWRSPRNPLHLAVEQQVAALARDYPDKVKAWGGDVVLRQPDLVEELLRLEGGAAPSPLPDSPSSRYVDSNPPRPPPSVA
jgi:hypothetical protein